MCAWCLCCVRMRVCVLIACTFINTPPALACTICGTVKGSPTQETSAPGPAEAVQPVVLNLDEHDEDNDQDDAAADAAHQHASNDGPAATSVVHPGSARSCASTSASWPKQLGEFIAMAFSTRTGSSITHDSLTRFRGFKWRQQSRFLRCVF